MKYFKIIIIIFYCFSCEYDVSQKNQYPPVKTINWTKIADNIIIDYRGKILSVEQLNSTTCWAILNPNITKNQAIKISENLGYYIRNSTGGIDGKTPSVHLFRNDKHIVIARSIGLKYKGEIKINNWSPSVFKGKYKP